jgi:beta-lactamase class A
MKKIPRQYRQGSKQSQFVLAVSLLILLALAFVSIWFYEETRMRNSAEQAPVYGQESYDKDMGSNNAAENTHEKSQPSEVDLDSSSLQTVLNEWHKNASGNSSIIISDLDGNTLASAGQLDKKYFAASLYKVFLAYFGYQQIDRGDVDPNELYYGEWTRLRCLDEIIRSSDSPCAEKLWQELGRENQTNWLDGMGIKNTDMVRLSTTAEDASKILRKIYSGDDLSNNSRSIMLSSMKDQDIKMAVWVARGF